MSYDDDYGIAMAAYDEGQADLWTDADELNANEANDYLYDYPEEDRMATPGEAHAEWHRNAGVPMGTPGCPQDACHGEEDWEYLEELYAEQEAAERAEWASLAPALREGEEPAPLVQYLIRPDHQDDNSWYDEPPF